MEPTIVYLQPKMAINSVKETSECGSVSRGPRPPPDGRENPAVHQEDPPSQRAPSNVLQEPYKQDIFQLRKQTLPKTNISEMREKSHNEHMARPFSETPKSVYKMSEKTYGRGKDAKSEGSVRDKIAMFSINKTTVPEPVFCNFDKKFTNLTKQADSRGSNGNLMGRSVSVHADPVSKIHSSCEWENRRDVEKDKTKILETRCHSDAFENYSSYPKTGNEHEKISPIILLNRALSMTNEKKTDLLFDSHKSTLDQLIEQRRKSMNKLRGLVIPESSCVVNLPEIKSKDSFDLIMSPVKEKTSNLMDKQMTSMKKSVSPTFMSPWDSQSIANNIPKYSPAFKRKPLQVYGPKLSKTKSDDETSKIKSIESKNQIPVKPPRTSLDSKRPFDHIDVMNKRQTLPPTFKTSSFLQHSNINNISPNIKSRCIEPLRSDTVDGPVFRVAKSFQDAIDSDDSSYLSTVSSPTPSLNTADNTESDSSSQSMLSHNDEKTFPKSDGLYDYSIQHGLYQTDNGKLNVCRTLSSDTSTSGGSSNSSTLTSGSQASCSSAGSTDTASSRILKPRSIEAINRKNILASAKCRSGKDNKFGSPLIERKFSDVESTDEDQHHKIKSNGTMNSIMRVAYSTVVEDKCSNDKDETDSTYSDESDCDYGSVTISKTNKSNNKISNGSVANNRLKANEINRILPQKVIKQQSDSIKSKLVTDKNMNNEKSHRIVPCTNYEEDPAKNSECESFDVSSCGEDEQENWFEIKLTRGTSGGVGVTLAGGADCEAKQVTIHKVLQGSAAERDGRLCKGDRVISINGHSMNNVTHAKSVAILKEPLPEVTLVICGRRNLEKPPQNSNEANSSPVISVVLNKTDDTPGGAGLGILLQGGGSSPILIDKLFPDGAAAKSGRIVPGSELVAVGATRLTGLSRTKAWGVLRSLPAGPVTLILRPP